MPRWADGPEHARARRRAHEAAVRGLVADAVTEAHEAHAAAQHDPAGSARAFLSKAALPAIRAVNGAGAPTLLPCLQKLVPLGSALSPLRWRGKLRRSWVEGVYKHKPRPLWPPSPPPQLCAMHPYRRGSQRSPALSCSTASDLAKPALSPRLGS